MKTDEEEDDNSKKGIKPLDIKEFYEGYISKTMTDEWLNLRTSGTFNPNDFSLSTDISEFKDNDDSIITDSKGFVLPSDVDAMEFTVGRKEKIKKKVEVKEKAVKEPKKGTQFKLFYVGTNREIETSWIRDIQLVDDIKECDVVMFGDGPFLNPALWEGTMVTQYAGHNLSYQVDDNRDISDIKAFIKARRLGKRIIGVGRGSKLCCILSGGKVAQHVSHPPLINARWSNKTQSCYVPFSNRMMMLPNMHNGTICILYSVNQARHHIMSNGNDITRLDDGEILIAYNESTDSLSIEGLPWHRNAGEHYPEDCNNLVQSYITNRMYKEYGQAIRIEPPIDREYDNPPKMHKATMRNVLDTNNQIIKSSAPGWRSVDDKWSSESQTFVNSKEESYYDTDDMRWRYTHSGDRVGRDMLENKYVSGNDDSILLGSVGTIECNPSSRRVKPVHEIKVGQVENYICGLTGEPDIDIIQDVTEEEVESIIDKIDGGNLVLINREYLGIRIQKVSQHMNRHKTAVKEYEEDYREPEL